MTLSAWVGIASLPVLAGQLAVHPAPEGAELNDDFDVRVRVPGGEWKELSEYLVRVCCQQGAPGRTKEASMAFFDFEGEVEVSVKHRGGPVGAARVRPLSLGIEPVIEGDQVIFKLDQPCDLSVEINGDIFGNLHLFGRSMPEPAPDPSRDGVIYFGPGVHELEGGRLDVPSGAHVYLDGGALVRGVLNVEGAEDVVISGRGVLEQDNRKEPSHVRIFKSRNVRVDGIFSGKVLTANSSDVNIHDVKSITYDSWGDGMNVFGSQRVVIDHVFNRNSDDCFTVYGSRGEYRGGASGITLKNSVLWADVAHPILIGTHGNAEGQDVLEDITISNIDILDHMERQLDYQGCMAINAGDNNLVRRVKFEDIRVEDFRQGQLVNLRVFYNRKYCAAPGGGIENVVFDNIRYRGTGENISIIAGYDESRSIRDVVFRGLVVNGVAISDGMKGKPGYFKTSDMAGMFVGEHVHDIRFEASEKVEPVLR